jgi:hypothetical protein
MGGGISVEKLSEEEERLVLDYKVSAKSIADKMRELEVNGECGVVVMAGAGISVSAGIPGGPCSYCPPLPAYSNNDDD